MAFKNRVEVMGNLGQDPEVVTLQDGIAANLSVGLTKKWRNKETGQPESKTEWIDVSVYGHQAKFCAEYLLKGMLVEVVGGLRKRKWQDGEKSRSVMEFVVNERGHSVQILSVPDNARQRLNEQPQQSAPQQQCSEQQYSKPKQPQQQYPDQHNAPQQEGWGNGYATPPQNQPNNSDRPFGQH
jgi:single-strand DNA-binding protein